MSRRCLAALHGYRHGASAFIGIPKIAAGLDQVRTCGTVHVHSHALRYVDHACIELIESWVDRRQEQGQTVHVKMEKLHLRYRTTRISESVL